MASRLISQKGTLSIAWIVLASAACLAVGPSPPALALTGPASRRSDAGGTPAPPAVRVVIDYGDGVEKHFTSIAWREKTTVHDALKAARKSPRGIAFDVQDFGGVGLLVTRIDDLKNEGAGRRNWTFRVNGAFAKKAASLYELKRSDEVRWVYGSAEPEF